MIYRYGANGPLSSPPLLGQYVVALYADVANDDCVWGEGECIPDCPSCRRLDELYAERSAGFEHGVDACIGTLREYYKVAPKAAEPLLARFERLKGKPGG